MKKFLTSPLWRIPVLTGLGVCVGLLSLILTSVAYLPLDAGEIFHSYFYENRLVAAVNCLPPVVLMWLGWFLTRRGWAAYLLGCVPCVAIGFVNYFKISLRSDPLLAGDLLLAAEAGGIMDGYTLEMTPVLWACLGCAFAGLVFAAVFLPKAPIKWAERTFGLFSSAAILICALLGVFLGSDYEGKLTSSKRR